MNLKALLEKRNAQVEANKRIRAAVEARGHTYEGTEKADLQAGVARVAELDEMIADAQAALATENKAPLAGLGLHGGDGSEGNGAPRSEGMANRNLRGADGQVDTAAVIAQMQAFASRRAVDASRVVSATGPFRTLGEQIAAGIAAAKAQKTGGQIDQRLLQVGASRGMNEASDPDGGFLIQPEFMEPMLDNIIATGQIAALCTRLSTSAPSVMLPRLKENSRVAGSRNGGVRAYWTGEGNSIPPSKPQFERVNVSVDKLAVLVPITEELSQDATFLGGWINTLGGAEMSFMLDDAILRGTGNGMPLGVLNSSALVTAAAEAGQPAGSITANNIYSMMKRVPPRNKGKAQWTGNQELYDQLLALKDDSDRNIFLQGQNISNAVQNRLLGYNYTELEQNSAPGGVGDLMFADWSQYLLIDRGGVQVDTSMHFYFDTAENAIRLLLRVGGCPLPSGPMVPYKGTLSLSPFVALAARK